MKKVMLVFLSALVSLAPAAWADKRVPPLDERLRSLGYVVDTQEQLEAAFTAGDYSVRTLAVRLLAEREGPSAIPKLKEYLADEHLKVRITASRELNSLGDTSGLETMCEDLESLTSVEEGEPEVVLLEEANAARLAHAMEVSLALAELGDLQGYELAEVTARRGPLAAQRYRAIWVLTEVAATGREQAALDGLDPGATLREIAFTEQSGVVQNQLIASMSRETLEPNMVVNVLLNLVSSPYASRRVRGAAIAELVNDRN